MPDGAISQDAASGRHTNIVDPVWAAVDWTLPRALRTARFWWIAPQLFVGARDGSEDRRPDHPSADR
jgi:hypothetical protein